MCGWLTPKPGIVMIVCKNCGRVFDGRYCNNCGQSANTRRINRAFIFKNFEHEILHFDHGIVFTIKEILIRPGITIKKFLEGKRKKYSHPLTYIAIISVVYFILRSVLVKYHHADTPDTNRIIVDFIYDYYPKLVVIIFIPLAAAFTPIFYQGKPYNFFELFTFHCYIRGQFMLFELLVLFINWLLIQLGYPLPVALITVSNILFNLLFMGWALQQFFDDRNYLESFFKAFGITVMLIACAVVLVIFAVRVIDQK